MYYGYREERTARRKLLGWLILALCIWVVWYIASVVHQRAMDVDGFAFVVACTRAGADRYECKDKAVEHVTQNPPWGYTLGQKPEL